MLERESRGSIRVLRLAHGKSSALDLELLRAIESELRDAEEEAEVQAVVLTGTGNIFCAGLDLFRIEQGGAPYVAQLLPALDDCLLRLFRFPKPIVAAVNGHAIAGGCILALACDARVLAGEKSTMGVSELLVGVPFPPVPFEIVRYAVAQPHLGELVLTGRGLRAEECLARGLADELVEPEALIERALARAEALRSIHPPAFAHTKRLLRHAASQDMQRSMERFGAEVVAAWSSPAVLAAIAAFVRKNIRRTT
jgi:enoyl-CoA hydratase/carnithine racemase